ncbi:FAD-binding oxidoreductase [Anaerospora sp.]|uniref:FAD-binding oxidoreductase n=1 Tax=Anaerospora sp. TaxID=1960278 RepID=UPI002896E266|nr:FAD-binding oxidoreductase [Anaerospora sp.]
MNSMIQYSKVTPAVVAELSQIVGEKYIITDKEKMEDYSHDAVTGDKYVSYPEVLVLPGTATEIAAIVKLANREVVPIIPRGAGTGYACAAVAFGGGIMVSTERLDQILEVDEANLLMVVEPGVRTSEVQKAAHNRGFLYAGEPSSGDSSFIGGNVATNAGGIKAVKYGTTRQQVLGIELVTAEGDIVTLGGKVKKDATGYNLAQLIVGSEGTLGIITKVYIKIMPRPQKVMDLLAVFPSVDASIAIVAKILQSGILPVSVEFMDNKGIQCCESYLNEKLPHSDTGNYIIVSIEGDSEDALEDQCVEIDELCSANGASFVLVADPVKIWKARKSFGEANRARSLIFSAEDIVVPVAAIADVVKKLAELGERYQLTIHCVAHAADGNVHADILKEDVPMEEWERKLPLLQEEIYEFVYSIGGKLSGEHGIGYKRLELMEKFTNPAELKLMRAVKTALDPKHIMNPGKIFRVN